MIIALGLCFAMSGCSNQQICPSVVEIVIENDENNSFKYLQAQKEILIDVGELVSCVYDKLNERTVADVCKSICLKYGIIDEICVDVNKDNGIIVIKLGKNSAHKVKEKLEIII